MSTFRDPYGQQWLEVERLPQALDLAPIAGALAEYRIPHRITEEGSAQVVWVARPEDQQAVGKFIDDWRRGELHIVQQDAAAHIAASAGPAQFWLILRLLPVTSTLLLLSLLGFLVVMADSRLLIGHWFTIVDVALHRTAGLSDLDVTEAWRLWTPMFLHFDLLHLSFNALFVWVFGARMERVVGSGHFLLFVLAVGLVANLGQLAWENNPRFGGMSGVNFGFVGYIWLRQMLAPHPMLVFPKALFPLLLISLLLGTFGLMDIFIEDGKVANAAHMSGLLAGVTWGVAGGLWAQRHPRRAGAGTSDSSRQDNRAD